MQAVKIVARDAKTHRGCLVEKGQDFEVELCWEIQEAEWNKFILFCVVSVEHSEESLERGGTCLQLRLQVHRSFCSVSSSRRSRIGTSVDYLMCSETLFSLQLTLGVDGEEILMYLGIWGKEDEDEVQLGCRTAESATYLFLRSQSVLEQPTRKFLIGSLILLVLLVQWILLRVDI